MSRSAEAERISSCLFADYVAKLSISCYRQHCPIELQNSYRQTVMAAFLMYDEELKSAEVISLGVGTKFLKSDDLIPDLSYLHKIRDCHAEVLARRGLLAYFHHQMDICLLMYESEAQSCKRTSLGSVIFEVCTSNNENEDKVQFKLRDRYSLHFYTSSQPCGNACVKKWGKSSAPVQFPWIPECEYPNNRTICKTSCNASCDCQTLYLKHPAFFVTAKLDGQIACSFKASSKSLDTLSTNATPHLGSTILSCSDKLAKWNCLGVQGGLLSNLISSPVYIKTVTVGRKYSAAHLHRAICCRVAKFRYPNLPSARELYAVNHPITMGTSVKFDTGVIITSSTPAADELGSEGELIGANFTESRCFLYYRTDVHVCEVIDGSTGYLHDKKEGNHESASTPQSSTVCSYQMFLIFRNLFNRLQIVRNKTVATHDVNSLEEYFQCKSIQWNEQHATEYSIAKLAFLRILEDYKGFRPTLSSS